MMNREMTLFIDKQSVNVYMLNGFFDYKPCLAEFHNHPFTEIQIVVNGGIHYSNFKEKFNVCSGQMIIMPPNSYHESTHMEPDTQLICFQVSIPVEECSVISLSEDIPKLLFNEVHRYITTGKSIKLPILLSLIISELINNKSDPALSIQNRAFLIHDFFSNNFAKSVTISDLANVLCVSQKQAERLVQKYTGNTFRQEIVRLRMEAAKQLIKTTNLTMKEIAEKVGYQSYSGFWKAYSAYICDSAPTNI